jgi:LmbE family N-acetylglucosaminyl deacetylase/glycosyltransferase involved in cell wall biosynthesis
MLMDFDLTPPTETSRIAARRVLVLSPHFDDEVFGCGGLLAQLTDSGAEVRVLYLTDSSGGDEVTDDREGYAARRRAEAQRCLDILGISQLEVLSISDGSLARFVDPAAREIRRVIGEHRPDLLLSVSPCEVSDDHRAAFASLHRALSTLRGGTDLDEIMIGCRILLYEVNHPGYPNLLVDVSLQLETLTSAIDAHSSQLELHNYREAALGVRHFRALSLPPSVTVAESFREIGFVDFITHGHGGLVRALGGVIEVADVDSGPLVSLVIRTKDRPELLSQAMESVAASTYRRVEVILVNDGGVSPEIPSEFPFPVVRVEMETNQGRAAAANAGVAAATGDYLGFLDDDDLVEPEHLATLTGLVSAADVRVAYTDAAVGVYELDPDQGWHEVDRRLPYSRDFDPDILLVDNYIPFNTLLIERELFDEAGPFDPAFEFFEDWEFLLRLASLTPFHHLPQVTAEYRHFRGSGHHILGSQPRRREGFLEMKAKVINRHRDRIDANSLARIADRLRGESVAAEESDATARRELSDLRLAHADMSDAYHRLNGERESLREERSRHLDDIRRIEEELAEHRRVVADLQIEIKRLHAEETSLRSKVAEDGEHLGRLYAEIDRLNGVVGTIERNILWRLVKRAERMRSKT